MAGSGNPAEEAQRAEVRAASSATGRAGCPSLECCASSMQGGGAPPHRTTGGVQQHEAVGGRTGRYRMPLVHHSAQHC